MKKRTTLKRILTVLTALLLFALLPLSARAATTTYSGKALAAVSTSLTTGSRTNGSFAGEFGMEPDTNPLRLLSSKSDSMDGIVDIEIDPQSGATLYRMDKQLPNAEEAPTFSAPVLHGDVLTASQQYSINDEKVIYDDNRLAHKMVCRYIGEHCTVWGCQSDATDYKNEKLMLTVAQAETIGRKFDGYYQDIVTAYGDWYDADGDGKLAIFCFDIGQSYKSTTGSYFSGKYTAGYFWSYMLADGSGSVNNGKVKYSSISSYRNSYVSTDCICMDTFPAMGTSKLDPLNDIEWHLSTLVHETQHLINFSYRVLGTQGISSDMETFMNEAFSMAAEHMICGTTSTANRINYFNNSSGYVTGYPLTYWDKTTDVLSNYSNSYLFGQYLRTRYAALKNDPADPQGNTFYKTLLQMWQSEEGSTSAIDIAASVLGTTAKQLVLDFWAAVYLKNDTGWYGFQGESWADRISPLPSANTQTSSIGNGGVRYYDLNGGSMSVSTRSNVAMLLFNSDGTVTMDNVPVLSDLSIERTAADQVELFFTASLSGTLQYALTDGAAVDPSKLTESASFSTGSNTLTLDISSRTGSAPTISYLVRDSEFMSEIASAAVPVFYDRELSYDGLLCRLSTEEMKLTVSGTQTLGERLCAVSYQANGRMLGCYLLFAGETATLPENTDYIGLISLNASYVPQLGREELR